MGLGLPARPAEEGGFDEFDGFFGRKSNLPFEFVDTSREPNEQLQGLFCVSKNDCSGFFPGQGQGQHHSQNTLQSRSKNRRHAARLKALSNSCSFENYPKPQGPGVDGYQALRPLSAKRPGLPV